MHLAFAATYETLRDQYYTIRSAMKPLRLTKWELFQLSLRKGKYDLTAFFSEVRDSWELLPSISKYTLVTVSFLVFVLVLDGILGRLYSLRRLGLPVLKRPRNVYRWDYKAILEEGARKYPDSPYILTYSGYEYVVYPPSFWDEIKRLPSSKASGLEWFTEVMFQGWRFLGTDTSAVHKAIVVDLARALPGNVRTRQKIVGQTCDAAIGSCPDGKLVTLFSTLHEIVAATNSISLIGPEVGTDPRWLKAIQGFTIAMIVAIYCSHAVPRVCRPLVSLIAYMPAWALYWYMRFLLRPTVDREYQKYALPTGVMEKDEYDTKFSMAKWLMLRYKPEERSRGRIAHDLIVTLFESTPTTAGTLYFLLAELSTKPGLASELRGELSKVIVDGFLPQTQLSELRKLDSFMRECSRKNPFGLMSLNRILLKPVQLSAGPELPAGTLICVDVHQMSTSEELWKAPEIFDPKRFLKLREQPNCGARHQFVSLGSDVPGWGDGAQACPGRAFAANSIKLILAHLLMNYDIQPPRANKAKRGSMPNGSMSPDMGAKIHIRERSKCMDQ